MVRLGSKVQHETILLQAALRRMGYMTQTTLITGEFGEAEDKAVCKFQANSSLKIDGIVGPRTWAKIDSEIEKKDHLFLVLHCSASPPLPKFTGEWIKRYHTKTKGWSRAGYQGVINLDGQYYKSHDFQNIDEDVDPREFTWGTRVFNKKSSHVCYTGGLNMKYQVEDTRTEEQKQTMATLVKYTLLMVPDLIVIGHNNIQRRGCPSFDVAEWGRSIGIPDKNLSHWGKVYS